MLFLEDQEPRKRLSNSNNVSEQFDLGKISFWDELITQHQGLEKLNNTNRKFINKRKNQMLRKIFKKTKNSRTQGIHQEMKNPND